MYWDNIKDYSEKNFKRLTGVELKTFRLMSEIVYDYEDKIIQKKGNHRSRPFKLSVEDQVLMLLMYYREYRTQYHIGETYGLHESNVGKNIKRIEKILNKSKRFDLPGKAQLAGTNHKFEVLIVDATESPIERPKKSSTFTIPGRRKNIQLKPK
jgi:Helix-turn-helix of DDE superfamily endonuclease